MVGFYLCQADPNNLHKCYYVHFCSISLNEREQCFSQPKLELYGLFRALRAYKIFIVGVRNLIIEVDVRYIHGMLNNPDTALSASVNCWIVSILTFHFELRHVPDKIHGPNGLSRQPPQPGDLSNEDNPDDFDNWVDNLYSFLHLLNPSTPGAHSVNLLFSFANEQATQLPSNITKLTDNASTNTYSASHTEAATLTD